MQKGTIAVILALLLVPVQVQAYHDGTDSGEAPNRAPVSVAGPDQRLSESSVILLNGENSYDPDPDDDEDLRYVWKIEERPQLIVGSGSQARAVDVPLQVAQDCIVEDVMGLEIQDWMLALHAPYIPAGTPPQLELVFNLTVYDRDPTVVEKMWPLGLPYDADGDNIPDYPHGWTGERTDTGEPIWYDRNQNATAYRNYTNHAAWDLVTVTVDNTNQPPHGDIYSEGGRVRSLCDEPHYIEFGLRHYRTGIDDQFSAPAPEYRNEADVDLWENRDDFIEFYVQGYDDEQIAVVEVYLYHETRVTSFEKETKEEFLCQIDDVDETYRFALGRKEAPGTFRIPFDPGLPAGPGSQGKPTDYPDQLYRGQTLVTWERVENWTGRMPVSTPELVAGEYRVCARAFDKQGGFQIADPQATTLSVGRSLQKNQSPPCLSILSPGVERAISPPVPESLPAKTPIKKFECTYELSPTDCTTFPEQVIGIGGVVRLDVAVIPWSLPGEPDYEPETAFLIEKVEIQNELTTASGAMLGPETLLEPPYVINLDTLARETTRIYVRAYDRVGGIAEMCIPVTPDPIDPKVLARVPENVYWGVNDTWRYYLQDKVPATSLQTITNFDTMQATNPGSRPDHVTTARTGGSTLQLPPLAPFPHYDITGDGIVDAIIDTNAIADPARLTDPTKRTYNAVWDYEWETLMPLSSGRCDAGRTMDYWIESDEGRGCGDDEARILGADASQGGDGLAPTTLQKPPHAKLPTDKELHGFLQSQRTHVLEHYVTPSAAQPLGVYAWNTVILDDAQNMMFLKGGIELSRYQSDIGIVSLEMLEPGKGRLPGDPVNITATIRHQAGIEGIALPVLYAWDDDPWAVMQGLELEEQEIRQWSLIGQGKILVHQCTQFGFPLPCLLDVGDQTTIHLNRTTLPGAHEVTLHVHPDVLVIEDDLQNNTARIQFEVYLGRTDTPDGSFYIRAGERGMPRLADGAIDLTTNKTYDLRLGEFTGIDDSERGARSVYLFDVDGTTYYWDPTERRDPADTEITCHNVGDSFTANCRPITVVQEPYIAPESKDSPGFGMLALVGLLISAVVLARRRR